MSREQKRVTLYTKTVCPYCVFASKWLTEQGIEFETINIEEDGQAQARVKEWGFTQVPVFDIEGDVFSGFFDGLLTKHKAGELALYK